jgi:Zn-dependent protease
LTTALGQTRDISTPEIVGLIVILVLSLSFHEVAHAWVAWKRGDSTAKDMGRITLDPMVHIDLWWTLIVPAMMYMSFGFIFGGAKPVPVVFQNLKKPHRDMALVAIAGPATNFLIAIFLTLILKLLSQEFGLWSRSDVGYAILVQGARLNLFLAVFNLMPLPPLDGSRIMTWLLPENMRVPYQRLESFGFLIILGLLYFTGGVVMKYLFEAIEVLSVWVEAIVTLGGIW